MSLKNLEKLYLSICKKKPNKKSLNALLKYPDRQKIIDFLSSKLRGFIKYESDYFSGDDEWGIIHSVKILGDLRAVESIELLIKIMDMVKNDPLVILYSYTIMALPKMGEPALEHVYKMYLKDRSNSEFRYVWLSVLANLGVKDTRIYNALALHFEADPVKTVNLMGDYGDKSFLPVVKLFVNTIAAALNAKKINPFEIGIRLKVPEAEAYIETREDWILLETGLPFFSEEFKRKVKELDNKLLKYALKENKQGNGKTSKKVSERKNLKSIQESIEQSFEELHIQNTFGRTVAVLLGGNCYPETLSFGILYPKIFEREVEFDTMEQAKSLTQSVMDLWNFLVDCQSPGDFEFLKYDESFENYIRGCFDEIREYLDIVLFRGSSDIFNYTKESQKEIENIKEECQEFEKILTDKSSMSSIDPSIIQKRVIEVWQRMFLIKTLEAESRKRQIIEGSYQPRIIKRKVGRNDPCPCGSGKKYKYCCMN